MELGERPGEKSDRELPGGLHDESRSESPQPSRSEDTKTSDSSIEINGPPESRSDNSAEEAWSDVNWIQKMKSRLSDHISKVNKELWIILSMFVIVALVNYLASGQRTILGLFTLPTLFSAYFFGRRHAVLTAFASIFIVGLFAYLQPSLFSAESAPEVFFDAFWYDIISWGGILVVIAYAMGTLHDNHVDLNENMRALLSVARDLTSEHDSTKLFQMIISQVTELMQAERTSFYVIDWKRWELRTWFAEQVDKISLPLDKGISGRVAVAGKPINVADAWKLPFFDRSFDEQHSFRTRSVLCVPVINRNAHRIGVLQVINKRGAKRFGENDQFILESLASQIAITLETSTLVRQLRLSFEGFVRTVSATVDAKHPLTAGHSQRVTDYSLMIGKELGLDEDELNVIKHAALLHDVGKIGIKDEVLLKNGPFSDEERAEMNNHPLKTRTILENFGFPEKLKDVPTIASQHHEKLNAEGYPFGLKGNEVGLGARIIAVSDVFDALTSPRDYPKYTKGEPSMSRQPMPLKKVIGIMKSDAGTHFDPQVVRAFFRCLLPALKRYRGTHFPPEYVDGVIRSLTRKSRQDRKKEQG